MAWRTKRCTIAWIKAHAGTEGNEAADTAAKQGAENKNNTLERITLPYPANTIKHNLDKAIRQIWKDKWQNLPHYKHTKLFYSGPHKQQASKLINMSRSQLTKLVSLVTGFNYLSYKQFKAHPEINPLCRLCGEENETFWHFITTCPRGKSIRDEVFLDKLPTNDKWRPNDLLNFSTYPVIYNLLSYDQDYNEQPIYEIDTPYSNSDSEPDAADIYRSYL